MEITTNSLEETQDLAADFVAKIEPQKEATIVGLYGNLGAGKTSFVQGVAKALAILETVSSPTFVIEKKYQIKGDQNFKTLIHIDAYRLESGEELKKLDWGEIVSEPTNLILLEWPERVADILPNDFFKLHFKFVDENKREIKIEDHEPKNN